MEYPKKARAGHRVHVKKIVHEVGELLGSFNGTAVEKSRLKHFETTLQRKWEILTDLDAAVLEKAGEDEIEAEICETSEFMDRVHLCMTELEDFKTAHAVNEAAHQFQAPKEAPAQPMAQDSPNGDPAVVLPQDVSNQNETSEQSPPSDIFPSPQSIGEVATASFQKVRLPKLELQNFNGEIVEWESFWDNFESLIHSNEGLKDVDKFSYLKAAVKEPAASAIRGLALTGPNYLEAITLLKERFGDSQRIISGHMDTLVNLPAVTSANDLMALRRLCDDVESHTRALKSLGRAPDQYGELFVPLFLNKVPSEIRLNICKIVPKDDWSLPVILRQFKEEVANRERCESLGVTTSHNSSPPKGVSRSGPASAAALTNSSEQHSQPSCVYCSQPHYASQCEVVTDVRKRKEILKKGGRCFVCTRKNHISRQCKSKSGCRKCRGRHHTSICQSDATQAAQTPTNPVGQSNAPQINTSNPGEGGTSATMCVGTKTGILLQTATATIFNPEQPQHKVKARLILDGGSQGPT